MRSHANKPAIHVDNVMHCFGNLVNNPVYTCLTVQKDQIPPPTYVSGCRQPVVLTQASSHVMKTGIVAEKSVCKQRSETLPRNIKVRSEVCIAGVNVNMFEPWTLYTT